MANVIKKMKVYESDFLKINYANDILIQEWSNSILDETIFKQELQNFLKLFLEYKPSKLLWNNKKLNFLIPEELNCWIEKEILLPQYQNGLKKLAFLITEDIYVQNTVIKSIESFKPYLKAEFFVNEIDAFLYLFYKEDISNNNYIHDLVINKIENNEYEILLQVHSETVEDAIVALTEITKFHSYRILFQEIFDSLTTQEKIIIRQVVYGSTSKEIADSLNIQTVTVDTHKKNLKRKINFKNSFELVYFAKAFGIISF